MDKVSFQQEVQKALENLRDPIRLGSLPIRNVLLPEESSGEDGWALSRFLLRSISDLEPPDHDAMLWPARRHRILTLRYVSGLSPAKVADEMAISRRHFYRLLNRALEEFATYLWNNARETAGEFVGREQGDQAETSAELVRREAAALNENDSQPDVRHIVRRVLDLLAPVAERLGVEITTDLPQTAVLIDVHPEILRQFLLALLSNMMQIRGAKRLHAQANSEADELLLTIGLEIVSQGGSVLEKELIDDSVLQLLEDEGAHINWDRATDRVRCLIGLPTMPSHQVLIVDDNEDVLSLFQRYLNSASYQSVVTRRGSEAIRIAHEQDLYAILLDLMMSGEDGWDVLESLASDADTADTPIIVCSVLEHGQLALMLGASRFLKKPVMRETLLQALEDLQG